MENIKEQIAQWLAPELQARDLFLVEVKVSAGGKKLEVHLDSNTGITINQCADMSRFLEKHLDGSGLVPENYLLEVSSPGMSNPLRVPRQYQRRVGRILDVWKHGGEYKSGKLISADEHGFVLQEVREEKKKKKAAAEPEAPLQEWHFAYNETSKVLLQINF